MAAVAFALVACDAGRIVAPNNSAPALDPSGASRTLTASGPSVVISQVYGGGGNSGATYKNDFIELHNRGAVAVDVTGWSVQYASATGSSWSTTTLSGTIAAGAYYLVQESQGAGGTVPLPSPNATGTLSMGGTDGKVILVSASAAASGTCPNTATLVDYVGYGTVTGCGGATARLSNTTAALRLDGGCSYTGNTSIDFTTGAPTPRNGASTPKICDGTVTPPPGVVESLTVSPTDPTVVAGATQQFTATAWGTGGTPLTGVSFTWSATPSSIATINGSGLATTSTLDGDAVITVAGGGKTRSTTLHVNPTVPAPTIRVSELHYDNTGIDAGEAIEIEGPVGTSMDGWSLVLYNGSSTAATDSTPFRAAGLVYSVTPLTGTLAQGAGQPACNARGVIVVNYEPNGIQNGGSTQSGPAADGIALVNPSGAVVEFLSYEGSFVATDGPAAGTTSTDIKVAESGSEAKGLSLHRSGGGGSWSAPSANDFGFVNACGGPVAPPPPSKFISFTGRDPVNDAPVPVGFEAQIFASELVDGSAISTTITWESLTPAIATIDQKGVFHALSAGTATFKATATDGTFGLRTGTIIVGEHSTINYTGNALFGEPTDADASDDYIVRRPEFTSSYNVNRGTPNWVSYRIESEYHPSGIDRCNCFTFDPLLPANFPRYTTGDYTGAGSFAGYGIDRGHLARSFDRTGGTLDNAATYYFSNIVPQAADLNQGPWKILEDQLGDSAYKGGRSVYVITGVIGSKGTVKGEGRITIPSATWKVAVLMPHNATLADIHSVSDINVIAVIMPNIPGIKTVDWKTYLTTVDDVEQQSGYDVLAMLSDNIERAVESNDRPPVARLTGPATGLEGSALSFSASTSSDPDAGDALTYAWSFGDGTTATGVNATHTYGDNGTYTVSLVVTDSHGVTDETSLTVTVANVAPTGTFTAPATSNEGSSFAISLAGVTDPSPADLARLTYAFDCGTGAGFGAPSTSLTATCSAADDATLTVRVRISDGTDVTEYTKVVTIANVAPTVSTIAGGSIIRGESFTSGGTFTDPGSDTFTATVSYGDGSAAEPLALSGTSFSLAHTYTTAGTFTVTVTVTDDDGGATSSTTTVTVASASQAITTLIRDVRALAATGVLNRGETNALVVSLQAAIDGVDRDNPSTRNQLEAFLNKIDALVQSGRLPAPVAASITAYVQRIIASL